MKKILHIEDNGFMTEEIRNQLTALGYDVKTAYSYESALDRWDENEGKFDCIILDLHINPDGMDEEQIELFFPMYGMCAFDYFMKNNKQKADLVSSTVIFSGYTHHYNKMSIEKNWNYGKIRQIEKDGFNISKLIDSIKTICNG